MSYTYRTSLGLLVEVTHLSAGLPEGVIQRVQVRPTGEANDAKADQRRAHALKASLAASAARRAKRQGGG